MNSIERTEASLSPFIIPDLDNLPQELFIEVMQYLDDTTLKSIRGTDSRFYRAAIISSSNTERKKLEHFVKALTEKMKELSYSLYDIEECTALLSHKNILGPASLLDVKKDYIEVKMALANIVSDTWHDPKALEEQLLKEDMPCGLENFFKIAKAMQKLRPCHRFSLDNYKYRSLFSGAYEKLKEELKPHLPEVVEILLHHSESRLNHVIYVVVVLILENQLSTEEGAERISLKAANKLVDLMKSQNSQKENDEIDLKQLALKMICSFENAANDNRDFLEYSEEGYEFFLENYEITLQIERLANLKNLLIRFFYNYDINKRDLCQALFKKINFEQSATLKEFQLELEHLKYQLIPLFLEIEEKKFKELTSLINSDNFPFGFDDFNRFYNQNYQYYIKGDLGSLIDNWQVESIQKYCEADHFIKVFKYLPELHNPFFFYYTAMALLSKGEIEKTEALVLIYLKNLDLSPKKQIVIDFIKFHIFLAKSDIDEALKSFQDVQETIKNRYPNKKDYLKIGFFSEQYLISDIFNRYVIKKLFETNNLNAALQLIVKMENKTAKKMRIWEEIILKIDEEQYQKVVDRFVEGSSSELVAETAIYFLKHKDLDKSMQLARLAIKACDYYHITDLIKELIEGGLYGFASKIIDLIISKRMFDSLIYRYSNSFPDLLCASIDEGRLDIAINIISWLHNIQNYTEEMPLTTILDNTFEKLKNSYKLEDAYQLAAFIKDKQLRQALREKIPTFWKASPSSNGNIRKNIYIKAFEQRIENHLFEEATSIIRLFFEEKYDAEDIIFFLDMSNRCLPYDKMIKACEVISNRRGVIRIIDTLTANKRNDEIIKGIIGKIMAIENMSLINWMTSLIFDKDTRDFILRDIVDYLCLNLHLEKAKKVTKGIMNSEIRDYCCMRIQYFGFKEEDFLAG